MSLGLLLALLVSSVGVHAQPPLNPTQPWGNWFIGTRNRVYGGIGYQVNTHFIVPVGFVKQANYNLPAYRAGQFIPQITSAKNNVVLALTYKLARRATLPATEHLPSQQD